MNDSDLSDEEAVARLRENERRVWRRFPLVLALTLPSVPILVAFFLLIDVPPQPLTNILVWAVLVWNLAVPLVFFWPRDRRMRAAAKRTSVKMRMLDDTHRMRRTALLVQILVLAGAALQAGYAVLRMDHDSGFIHGVQIFQIGLFLTAAILYPAIFSLLVKRPLPSGAPDELTASLGAKALRIGYLVALPLLIGLAGVAFLAPASLWWTAPTLIWLAACAPLLAFVILDLRADRDG